MSLNGDGYDDLAIGVPNEDVTGTDDGAVNVVYGSINGLTSLGNQLWTQGTTGIEGTAESGDLFGSTLASMPPRKYKKPVPLIPMYFLLD